MYWWEERKHIFAREAQRLNKQWPENNFTFYVKEGFLWLAGNFPLHLSNGTSFNFEFEMKYPANYPFYVPFIYPKDMDHWVPGHQFVKSRRFCLDIRERTWNSKLSAVDIIESLERLLKAELKRSETDGHALDVYEEPEPTKLDKVTQEIKAVVPFPYLRGSDAISGGFDFHARTDFHDNRIIVAPAFENLKEIVETSYFPIWSTHLFNPKTGLWFRTTRDALEILASEESFDGFKSKLEQLNIIPIETLNQHLQAVDEKYCLFFVDDIALLLTKLNVKENKLEYFGCYNQDITRLQDRLPSSQSSHKNKDQKVTIIGCGSAGSFIAEELVKSGETNLVLIDDDYLTIENVIRHSCDLRDTGLKKIHALKNKLWKINPAANIECIDEKINVISPHVETKIKDSALIINATATIEEVVNDFCWKYKIPSIYSIVYPEGIGGEVLRVLPNVTPCFECMNFHLNEILKSTTGFDDFPNNKYIDYNTTKEGEIVAIPGLSADIKFVSLFVVKFALEVLHSKMESLKDQPNVVLWGNDKKWIFTQKHECLKVDTSNFYSLHNCLICFGDKHIEDELQMTAEEVIQLANSIHLSNGTN